MFVLLVQLQRVTKLPFSLSNYRASHPLAWIHTNLWGPALTPSTIGARYFLLFIDDFSRFSWIHSLHTKDQALPTFIKFKTMVENQISFCIQCLQSNNGGEFKTFTLYLTTHRITHICSYPYTPDQNGRVKWKMRHLVETSLALLAITSLPLQFWLYAFHTTTYLTN